MRIRAVRLVCDEGWSTADVAKAVGRSQRSVQLWVQKSRHGKKPEQLRTKKAPGMKPKLNKTQPAKLVKLLQKGPVAAGFLSQLWTGPRLHPLHRLAHPVRPADTQVSFLGCVIQYHQVTCHVLASNLGPFPIVSGTISLMGAYSVTGTGNAKSCTCQPTSRSLKHDQLAAQGWVAVTKTFIRWLQWQDAISCWLWTVDHPISKHSESSGSHFDQKFRIASLPKWTSSLAPIALASSAAVSMFLGSTAAAKTISPFWTAVR